MPKTAQQNRYWIVTDPNGYQVRCRTERYDRVYGDLDTAQQAIRDFLRQDREAAELAADGPAAEDETEQLRERLIEIIDVMREWAAAQTDPAELRRCLAELESH